MKSEANVSYKGLLTCRFTWGLPLAVSAHLQGSRRLQIFKRSDHEHFHFPGCALWSLHLKIPSLGSSMEVCTGLSSLLETVAAHSELNWKYPLYWHDLGVSHSCPHPFPPLRGTKGSLHKLVGGDPPFCALNPHCINIPSIFQRGIYTTMLI